MDDSGVFPTVFIGSFFLTGFIGRFYLTEFIGRFYLTGFIGRFYLTGVGRPIIRNIRECCLMADGG
jgi:hypothetical protein